MITRPKEDVEIFADHCVLMRSIYLHGKILFEESTRREKTLMSRAANIFFSDLNRVLIEYVILQVCKITDPAQDARKNDNLTIAFLLDRYGFDLADLKLLNERCEKLRAFREKLLPARNKRISHFDRNAAIGDFVLGAASTEEWDEFWLNLQDVICIIHKKAVGEAFYLNAVGMLSDADGLLRALRYGAHFQRLLRDPVVGPKCAKLAFDE